jgi:hypothetical protein
MSMNATFVQVDTADLSRLQGDPSLVEALFEDDAAVAAMPALVALTKTMQDRARAAGPQMLADALARLDPAIRKQLEERLGRSTSALAAGAGGDDILKLMENAGRAAPVLRLPRQARARLCRSTRTGTAFNTFSAAKPNRGVNS